MSLKQNKIMNTLKKEMTKYLQKPNRHVRLESIYRAPVETRAANKIIFYKLQRDSITVRIFLTFIFRCPLNKAILIRLKIGE